MALAEDTSIPKQGWAGVVVNEGLDFSVQVQKVDVPEPKDHELLIRLNVTGLCMSDVHYMQNDWATVPKMSEFGVRCAGHEGAGVVVKLGARCVDWGWKVGDRVGIKPFLDVCHNCEQCWKGRENYCSKATYTGLMAPGTYQQYLVSPAIYTSRIPDAVPDDVAGPIMCSASTMHRALIDAQFMPGDWIVIPGAGGGVGIQGVQLAKAMGMRPIAVDSGQDKQKLCLRLGAEAFVDFREVDDVAARIVQEADGIGAHGVLVTAYQAYDDAIKYTGSRKSAKIVCIALPPAGQVQFATEPSAFVFNNMKVTGSLVGTMQDTAACLALAARGLLKGVSEVRGRSQWAESVQQLKRGEVAGRVVIDFNRE